MCTPHIELESWSLGQSLGKTQDREELDLEVSLWDNTTKVFTGRRFVPIAGPLGAHCGSGLWWSCSNAGGNSAECLWLKVLYLLGSQEAVSWATPWWVLACWAPLVLCIYCNLNSAKYKNFWARLVGAAIPYVFGLAIVSCVYCLCLWDDWMPKWPEALLSWRAADQGSRRWKQRREQ